MISSTLPFFVRRARIGCVSGLVGGFAIFLSIFIIDLSLGSTPGTFYMVVGMPLGMYGIEATLFGLVSHMLTAALIGTVFGIGSAAHKRLDIGSFKKGAVAGMVTGAVVFLVFFVPISMLLIIPQIEQNHGDASEALVLLSNMDMVMIGSLEMHVVYGAAMGTFFAIAVRHEAKRQLVFQGA